MNASQTLLCLVSASLLVAACSPRSSAPYTPQSELARDPNRAQALTLQAADLISNDPEKAESLLRQALAADLYHGPAHNNLGVLYLGQGKLYDAAGEFEWAKKLMPGHPDPRLNLALTLQRAGRIDEALASCRSALEVYPDHLPSIEAMAMLQVRHGRADEQTPSLLAEIALRSESQQWRDWARLEAVRRER